MTSDFRRISVDNRVHYVDLRNETLLDADLRSIRLPPKEWGCLVYFVSIEPRSIVSIDDLIAAVWNVAEDTVGNDTVTKPIHALKKALGDSGSDNVYIQTVRGRGYRFTGAVAEIADIPRPAVVTVVAPEKEAADSYSSLALLGRLGEVIDTPSGIGVIEHLRTEFPAIEADCDAAFRAGCIGVVVSILDPLIALMSIASLPGGALRMAADLSRNDGDWGSQAKCLTALGTMALDRGQDHKIAEKLHSQALALFRKENDEWGIAQCALGLGKAEFRGGYHRTARDRYEQGLKRFEALGDHKGIAECNVGLGDVALARNDLDGADAHYMSASDHIDCIDSLSARGLISERFAFLRMFTQHRPEIDSVGESLLMGAIEQFENAGNLLGEAKCYDMLGRFLPNGDQRRIGFRRRAIRFYQKAGHSMGAWSTARYIEEAQSCQAD